ILTLRHYIHHVSTFLYHQLSHSHPLDRLSFPTRRSSDLKPEKKKIISRKKSYHGVAMGATSATGIPEFHKFTTSIAPDFYYVDSSVEALQEMIDTEGADSIAAFISEPVQG